MRRLRNIGWAWLALLAVAAGFGCGGDDPPVAGPTDPAPLEGDVLRSVRADLQWKRYAAVEADLVRALELTPDQVCMELGQANCIREVHLVSLGGNDPFRTGLQVPSAEPLATTSTVIDRVLLSACGRRAALDREAGQEDAKVFHALDLEADAPEPTDERVTDTVEDLYRRLLSRDPQLFEVAQVAELVVDAGGDPISATDFATLACYAIGTTTEFLFF